MPRCFQNSFGKVSFFILIPVVVGIIIVFELYGFSVVLRDIFALVFALMFRFLMYVPAFGAVI